MMRRDPERCAEIARTRRRMLHENMNHTLTAMKAAAEQLLP